MNFLWDHSNTVVPSFSKLYAAKPNVSSSTLAKCVKVHLLITAHLFAGLGIAMAPDINLALLLFFASPEIDRGNCLQLFAHGKVFLQQKTTWRGTQMGETEATRYPTIHSVPICIACQCTACCKHKLISYCTNDVSRLGEAC